MQYPYTDTDTYIHTYIHIYRCIRHTNVYKEVYGHAHRHATSRDSRFGVQNLDSGFSIRTTHIPSKAPVKENHKP